MSLAYVSHSDSADVALVEIAESGAAMSVIGRWQVGGSAMPMAVNKGRTHLHVARRSNGFAIVTFAIDPDTRRLDVTSEVPIPASAPYIALDRREGVALTVGHFEHVACVNVVNPDGTIGPVRQCFKTGLNPHAILPDPDSRFVVVTSLGDSSVIVYPFDTATGMIVEQPASVLQMRANVGCRHLTWDRSGKIVFLLNELDATVDRLSYDAAAGKLQWLDRVDLLPADSTVTPSAAEIAMSADGKHLYASERATSVICWYSLDGPGGRPVLRERVAAPNTPRGFTLSPDGRFLLAAGQGSGVVAVFRLESSGRPTECCSVATGDGPNWITFI